MDSKPPPDEFLRHLETLEDPSKPPVTVYTHNPTTALQNFQAEQNASVPTDQEIRGRLQKLRKRLVASPSVEELEERLARLQGIPLKSKAKSFDISAMPLSGEEQTRRLLTQLQEELTLEDTSPSQQQEIEARLARLKGCNTKQSEPKAEVMEAASDSEGLLKQIASQISTVPSQEEDDEDSELKLVNKYLAQVALAEKLGVDDSECSTEVPIEEDIEDELPWCCICNEDATLRCPGCAGDLYCSRCFKEGHDVCNMSDHKPTAYESKLP